MKEEPGSKQNTLSMVFQNMPYPHVISLDWKGERRRLFFNSAENQGFTGIETFRAIEGTKMADLPSWARANPGAYGCLHSHVSIYRQALALRWPAVTIFEDDASINGTEQELVLALNARPEHTDIFMLHPRVKGCLGAWGYVIFPNLMREIVNRVDLEPFPEGYLAHIDQLIYFLCERGWVMAHAKDHLVSHVPRDANESTVEWVNSYRGAEVGAQGKSGGKAELAPSATATILIGICSCVKNRQRREAIRKTWLSSLPDGIEARFFVGDSGVSESESELESDTLFLEGVRDSYDRLPDKVLSFFRYALDNFEFDWLFKCDDDTYIAPERLFFLTGAGVDLVGNEFVKEQGFASGGAGYLVSRRWVERVACDPAIPKEGAEDVIITGRIIAGGGTAVSDRRLRWNSKDYPRPENEVITSHWCSPAKMLAIHTILHAAPANELEVIHPDWTDRIKLYSNSYFYRASSFCLGIWRGDPSGTIKLSWFDWEEEYLRPLKSQNASGEEAPAAARQHYFCDKYAIEELVVELVGGLGNQMFQYAHGLATARRLGAELKLVCSDPKRGFRLGCFGLSLCPEATDPKYIYVEKGGYHEGAEWQCFEEIIRSKARTVKVSGYFQNPAYFASVANEIRSLFLPEGDSVKKVHGSGEVAIHVRRGDFVGNQRHDICRLPYYLTAIRLIRALIGNPCFRVISDDPRWCEAVFREVPDVKVSAACDEYEAFMDLCSFRSFILSNSTFGWWAAWLADGSPVIAPSRFLADKDWNICPDEWITMPPAGLQGDRDRAEETY